MSLFGWGERLNVSIVFSLFIRLGVLGLGKRFAFFVAGASECRTRKKEPARQDTHTQTHWGVEVVEGGVQENQIKRRTKVK